MEKKSLAQIVTGLIILAIGVGFLLEAFHLVDFGKVVSVWWPSIIIIIGLVSLINNVRAPLWPIAEIVLGTLLLLRQFGVVAFDVWQIIWTSLIILAGVSILFERSRSGKRAKENDKDGIDATAIFSGQEIRSVSHQFKGGAITAIFGGVDLDLRDAKLDGNKATIDVFTAFGGSDIRVPEGWTVKISGTPIFGGWEDKTHKPADVKNAPHLTINGTCLFGGVSIKN